MQKVCFSDREKFSKPYRLHPHPKIGAGTKFYRRFCRNSDDRS
ncbi:Hypothetical protein G436_1235 [Leptospira interrogans serovar Hardjo str. Norma]|uniref:Uncharacterized protein n=1 Tax=Leptospira interrogans serovar Hardjo str. Norma TaxID=1279460 RepID=A0A0M5L7B8_LEPIR|nr:Hypothetical protein G436_1235 [Leptospira interrogans serovar Hardjo str. Norma]